MPPGCRFISGRKIKALLQQTVIAKVVVEPKTRGDNPCHRPLSSKRRNADQLRARPWREDETARPPPASAQRPSHAPSTQRSGRAARETLVEGLLHGCPGLPGFRQATNTPVPSILPRPRLSPKQNASIDFPSRNNGAALAKWWHECFCSVIGQPDTFLANGAAKPFAGVGACE